MRSLTKKKKKKKKKKRLVPSASPLLERLSCKAMNSALQSRYCLVGEVTLGPGDKTHLARTPGRSMLLIVFIWLPCLLGTRSFYKGGGAWIKTHVRLSQKMLDPFGMAHIGAPRVPTKQVWLGKKVLWDKGIKLNNTHRTRTPDIPMSLMGFNQLPTKSMYDTRSFYRGKLRTKRDSCVAIEKMFDPFGVPNIG